MAKNRRERAAKAQDPRAGGLNLVLGWAAKDDFSDSRILDRMMLYERRIENSLHKTLNRLKQYQVIRQVEKDDANRRPAPETGNPAGNLYDLKKQSQFNRSPKVHRTPTWGTDYGGVPRTAFGVLSAAKTNLKKQSQFAVDENSAKSYLKGNYEEIPTGGGDENKAKQSQFSGFERREEATKEAKSVSAGSC